ncbi:RHS repeat-associated core domain-containing protein [Actinoallomurus sp. CA-142502]|uniref:RHS repeat-associated core domain-containing protein n=1 Tax=Actinoallomurus sp. CA-142502 TaxID=3239885 RepID=UPI003D908CBB
MGIGSKAGVAAERLGLFRALGSLLRSPATHAIGDAARTSSAALRTTLRSTTEALGRGKEFAKRVLTRDPIDVASGEVVLRQVDVELEAVLPMVIERTHLSSWTQGRLFGPSWASTLDQHLEIDDDGVCLAGEDGMVLAYPEPPPGQSVPPENGPPRLLARTAEGGYTVSERGTGRTWHFAPFGGAGRTMPLRAITDRNGNRIDLAYDEAGILRELRHSGGYTIGVRVEDGRVRSLCLRSGEPAGDIELVRYGYDEVGRLTDVVDSSGEPLRFSYDTLGRLTGWTDRNGHWYRYEYDEQGRAVRGTGSGGFLDATLTYDVSARVTTVTDSLGHTTAYHLNEIGQVVAEVDPLGRETRREWDLHDRLLAETDPLGNTTRYHYDTAGDLTAVQRPDGHQARATYNDLGLPVEVTQADGGVWRYGYDERGNLTHRADPLGAVTRYTHDERGVVTSVIDATGGVQRLRSNAAGLPVEVTDPDGATSRYERDAFGRVVTAVDPLGGSTRLRWTVEGRLTERVFPDGTVERWTYDAEGNEVEYADASGQVTRTEYTNFDVPTARTTPGNGRLEFTLDTELRLVAVTNPSGLIWRYEYNAAGELVGETDFNGRTLGYVHDAAGRLTERVNGAGQVTRYTRDRLGDVVRQYDDQETVFTRDLAGRVIRAVNADADVRIDRDAIGRITAETCNGRVLSNVYDALGRRVGRRTPSGAESVWNYDAMGRPLALRADGQTVRFKYDLAGREVRRYIGDGAILDQRWDAGHRLIAQTLWGAPVRDGRVTTGPAPSAPGAARLLQHRAYRYRPDGHVIGIADQISGERRFELDPGGRVTSAAHARGWTERYAYDQAGNVTFAAWPESSAADAPADAGEREIHGTLARRTGTTHHEYDDQGRVVARRRRTLSGQVRVTRFTWSADDRLVAVTVPDGSTWRYRYDPFGRRIAKQRVSGRGGEETVEEQIDFTWDEWVLAERTHTVRGGDGATTTWNHGPGTFRPLTQTDRTLAPSQEWVDRRFQAIISDLTGSATELVDAAGHVTWHRSRTVWGVSLPSTGAEDACPLRFPGQYHDAETGLDYNYHRYYDPATGRYQSPDPLGLTPQPNPHAYTRNPITLIDPLGLSPYPAEQNLVPNVGNGDSPGLATLHYHGKDNHFSIEVTDGTSVSHTHLMPHDGVAIVGPYDGPQGIMSHTFDLPNAKGALEFQRDTQGDWGTYQELGNSCLTYCTSVLRAGGVDAPAGKRAIPWARKLMSGG